MSQVLTMTFASVNCYLVRAGDGFVLIDTGKPEKRSRVEMGLARAGCTPGRLKPIVLTHGDYDHAGNAAYLRETHWAKIAMHRDDSERVARGDWSLDVVLVYLGHGKSFPLEQVSEYRSPAALR